MQTDQLRRKVEHALGAHPELQTLVPVLHKLQRIVADRKSSSHELGEAIKHDSILSSKVLRVVNSACFDIDRRISDVDEAVVLLGYNQVRQVISGMITTGLSGKYRVEAPIDAIGLWKHSLGTASSVSWLQKNLRLVKITIFLLPACCAI